MRYGTVRVRVKVKGKDKVKVKGKVEKTLVIDVARSRAVVWMRALQYIALYCTILYCPVLRC